MQTQLAESLKDTADGQEADAILRKCVHCGFCTATCPTYQVTGNELDSPRGRIYLIKQMLEGEPVTAETQGHLDSCLTCRNCESTCPSGVQYGHLVDIGRKIVNERVPRSRTDRFKRAVLKEMIGSPAFNLAMQAGQALRPMLPGVLAAKVPTRRPAGNVRAARHARNVLILAGCVQPAMIPAIDAATIRVLDAIGVGVRVAAGSGCCGAVRFHLDDQDGAKTQMRANIDAWWPDIEAGTIDAIVMNASGCGAMVREYAHHLRHDPVYSGKAVRVSDMVRDIAEIIAPHADALRPRVTAGLPAGSTGRVAFHPPCTLQHWQRLRPVTEKLLVDLGLTLQPFTDSHLCCGSAGTYSVLQPAMAGELRRRKLDAIEAGDPEMILSSNIGCLTHLQGGTKIPVRHWVELVDTALAAG
ncbi:glycolate oxidase subunit GlcF [Pigmentiphaga litoralis]|uniref:Glycolate oxidase iron-sulfur subunit n=1 Tax=Pigmentiphaga litoralis TaxID=516702 RepID=A0A7Y9IY81_9BURK|nr:glycolate oxidase subunit GlcF [Pigmentiphaga litoralis]NYE26083.1 glycolate oxidase iron-sulfur subunit [Pigmentiphaga litoralis]NYE85203.1 glycolate oxidase iron-sulfur subunit [Pigmentiphaga litoralis]